MLASYTASLARVVALSDDPSFRYQDKMCSSLSMHRFVDRVLRHHVMIGCFQLYAFIQRV